VALSFIASASGGVLNSGEIGLRFLFNTLQQLGRPDLVYRMVMQEEHPSYARFVRKGETTLPEYWADTGRSRNHDMMGQVMEWLYVGLLGLSSEDGYSHMTISPLLPPDLDWVEGSYEAITGPVRIRFEQTKTQHRLEVAIPDNTRARLVLPGRYSRVLCNHIAVPEPNRPLDVVGGIYELTGYLEKEQA
ncbi:MAG: alpha-L-rhamnosidase C-terminal domain-containing protein, partial [Eubacteriales bacterium]|nr:alpha-L-rhamnosidase C-terminal domain-containing protein [Eubacteriales bacterium]